MAENEHRQARIRPFSRVPSLLRHLKHQLYGRAMIPYTYLHWRWQNFGRTFGVVARRSGRKRLVFLPRC